MLIKNFLPFNHRLLMLSSTCELFCNRRECAYPIREVKLPERKEVELAATGFAVCKRNQRVDGAGIAACLNASWILSAI
jgi:hypothetical protein